MSDDQAVSNESCEREFSLTTDGTVLEFESPSDSVAQVIVRAVARRSGRDPLGLPPLQTVVDCDALDALFGCRPGRQSSAPDGLTITFEYVGYGVTVDSSRVVVEESGG